MSDTDGITHQVSVWIENDGNYFDAAQEKARGHHEDFREWMVDLMMSARKGSPAWYVLRGILWSWVDWRRVAVDLMPDGEFPVWHEKYREPGDD